MGVFVSSDGDEMAADADDGDAGHVSTACMTSEVRTWGRRSDTFDMMRLWSRWKSVRALGRSATPSSGLQAEAGEMIDFGADGGAMSWRSSAGETEAFYPVDPYLIELGWRAWVCMGEENILGQLGFSDHLVSFLEGGRAA